MSPNQKFVLTLVSICFIATLALATGMVEMVEMILHLSEKTRSHLQGVAVIGQILLLVAQSIERIHAGLRVIRDFKAAPQPIFGDDVSCAGEELEICVQTGPARHSPDYTILTQRHLSREESFVSASLKTISYCSPSCKIRNNTTIFLSEKLLLSCSLTQCRLYKC